MLRRCFVLLCKFGPLLLVSPACIIFWSRGGEDAFWRTCVWSLEAAGPTFLKLAQWASSRPDLLPASVVRRLSALQATVHPHAYEQTEELLAEAFGNSWKEVFRLDPTPVGSGCMGQVYHGWLLDSSGAETKEIAVKVRHPGAWEKIEQDLEILRLVAQSLEFVWARIALLSVSDIVEHFGAFILPQADMRVEAANLDVFNQNFPYASTGKGLPVRFPKAIRPYVTDSVLMMSFERATPLPDLIAEAGSIPLEAPARLFQSWSQGMPDQLGEEIHRTACRRRTGKLSIDAFMQMLFTNNFVHGDMHPGNILVSLGEDGSTPEVVVLDTGLAIKMRPVDWQNFMDVLHAIAMRDCQEVGKLMVERSPGDRSKVLDEDRFIEGVAGLVHTARDKGMELGKYGLCEVLSQMLALAYSHRVKLETSFVTVVTSIIVMEGIGRQLEPNVDIIEVATPYLIKVAASNLLGAGLPS